MRVRSVLGVTVILSLVGCAVAASAQETAPTVRDAVALREAGQFDQALSIADAVLAKSPTNTDAARLKIEILLVQSSFLPALETYDRYVVARRQPDRELLAVVAASELRRLSDHQNFEISVRALERLAKSGDVTARRSLITRAETARLASAESVAVLTSLSRLGDAGAEAALGGLLAAVRTEDKVAALQAVREGGARTQASKVAAMLADGDPAVRIAAIQTLSALLVPETVPQLQAVYTADAVPTVKMFAGVALKRLGQSSADAQIAAMLARDVADARLMAGYAYETSKTTQWVTRVRGLATEGNEQHRVQVAQLLACCDIAFAQSLLREALASPNPLLRREAAQVLESKALADAALVRRLLGDADELVRLMGAGAALGPEPRTIQPVR